MRVGLQLDREIGSPGSAEITEAGRSDEPVAISAQWLRDEQPLLDTAAGPVNHQRRPAGSGHGILDRAEAGFGDLAMPFDSGNGLCHVAPVEHRDRSGDEQGERQADEDEAMQGLPSGSIRTPYRCAALAARLHSLKSRNVSGLRIWIVRSDFSRMMPLALSCEMMRETVSIVRPR